METYSVACIICPQCGAELNPTDEICPRCGAPTAGEPEKSSSLMDRPWLLLVVLLHVGLLGIPLYWKTKYSLPVRLAISVTSIVYTVFVVVVTILVLRYVLHAVQL